ncbi:MAG: hypothetical protein NTU89_00060, partial [Candidatus Dependentiae bacterium]|nr:hypothetical protein [Candidatus Dependentiae bacterium]
MSTNQKYLFCVLSLLVSSQAVGMKKTSTQLGRAGTTSLGQYLQGVGSKASSYFSSPSNPASTVLNEEDTNPEDLKFPFDSYKINKYEPVMERNDFRDQNRVDIHTNMHQSNKIYQARMNDLQKAIEDIKNVKAGNNTTENFQRMVDLNNKINYLAQELNARHEFFMAS